MRPSELIDLLCEFYRERMLLCARHEAGARLVGAYELNNAYQYIIAREQMQLDWLRRAILDLGAEVPEDVSSPDPPASASAVLDDDVRRMTSFVDRWRDRLTTLTHARHRRMLDVILGETLEHLRCFEQARAGRTDLLGPRPAGAGTGGGVLPTRWTE